QRLSHDAKHVHDVVEYNNDIRQELSLTPEQAAQFDKIEADFSGSQQQCNVRMPQIREHLIDELFHASPDLRRIEELLQEMTNEMGLLQRKMADRIIAEKDVLRPDQREKFMAMLNQYVCY